LVPSCPSPRGWALHFFFFVRTFLVPFAGHAHFLRDGHPPFSAYIVPFLGFLPFSFPGSRSVLARARAAHGLPFFLLVAVTCVKRSCSLLGFFHESSVASVFRLGGDEKIFFCHMGPVSKDYFFVVVFFWVFWLF